MGDMGDMYRDWAILKKERKSTNKERILNLLNTNGIQFIAKNESNHLIVTINDNRIDIWPTTNKVKFANKYFGSAYQFLLSKIKGLGEK
jgi:hypothetical protein